MNFSLSKPYRYAHLKIWFQENRNALPESLDTEHADFRDVRLAVDAATTTIDAHFETSTTPNAVIDTYKSRLVLIYDGLQDREQWNKPMKKAEEKSFR